MRVSKHNQLLTIIKGKVTDLNEEGRHEYKIFKNKLKLQRDKLIIASEDRDLFQRLVVGSKTDN